MLALNAIWHACPPSSIPTLSRRDVTDVFEAFHDDPRQRRKLEAFRVGTLVGYTPSPLVEDFRALKQEIAEEGLFEVKRMGWGQGGAG